MSRTPYLDLNIPDKSSKGFVVTDVFEPNFTKLDQEAERINLRKMSTEDNIEELKKANRYKLGDIVEVLGFHTKGDGSHHKRIAKDADDGSGEQGQDGIWWCIVHSGEVNVSWFGAKGDGVTDDTTSIKKAIKFANSSINPFIVKFTKGTFLTDSIDMKDCYGINIKGNTKNYYPDFSSGTTSTVLKCKSDCDVFLKMSEVGVFDKNLLYSSKITIEGILFDCDNKAETGINLNFDVNLIDVFVTYAKTDGIVIEDFTYPVKLVRCFSAYNGRHGLHAVHGATTVYYLQDCEFSRNNGYGMLISGGAGAQFTNTVIQSNKTGGIKILGVNDTLLTQNYLQNIRFNYLYTEHNGLLENTDPNYEGNFALVIEGEGALKPIYLVFDGHMINKSTTGKTLKVRNITSVKFTNGSFNTSSVFDLIDDGSYIDYESLAVDENIGNVFPSNISSKFITSYITSRGRKAFNKVEIDSGHRRLLEFSNTLSTWGNTTGLPTYANSNIIKKSTSRIKRIGAFFTNPNTGEVTLALKKKDFFTGATTDILDLKGRPITFTFNSSDTRFFDRFVNSEEIRVRSEVVVEYSSKALGNTDILNVEIEIED
ncbi:MAG: glycosyl hydrolase family 28-related protein [Paraclostridium sp.]